METIGRASSSLRPFEIKALGLFGYSCFFCGFLGSVGRLGSMPKLTLGKPGL